MTEIPFVTAIVYLLLTAFKMSVSNQKLIRLIPLFAAGLGMLFGVLAWFVIPEVHSAGDIIQAIYHGIAAGLAATGVHQVFKQMAAKGEGI